MEGSREIELRLQFAERTASTFEEVGEFARIASSLPFRDLAGNGDGDIANELSINRKTVMLWRNRFAEKGLQGLWEIAPGRGRKPTYDREKVAATAPPTLTMVFPLGPYLS